MDVTEIGIFEAKTRLSELIEHVRRGRVYRITKRGTVVAEIRPVTTERARPVFGEDRGRITMARTSTRRSTTSRDRLFRRYGVEVLW